MPRGNSGGNSGYQGGYQGGYPNSPQVYSSGGFLLSITSGRK